MYSKQHPVALLQKKIRKDTQTIDDTTQPLMQQQCINISNNKHGRSLRQDNIYDNDSIKMMNKTTTTMPPYPPPYHHMVGGHHPYPTHQYHHPYHMSHPIYPHPTATTVNNAAYNKQQTTQYHYDTTNATTSKQQQEEKAASSSSCR